MSNIPLHNNLITDTVYSMLDSFGPEVIPQLLNVIIAGANIFWTFQLKSIQTSQVMVNSLKLESKEKDEVIQKLMKKKNEYKTQYESLLAKFKKQEGELEAYRKVHNK